MLPSQRSGSRTTCCSAAGSARWPRRGRPASCGSAVNPTLPVGAVNDGMRRGMAARQLRWNVPDDILAAYLHHRDDVQLIGDTIRATRPPDDAQLPALQRDVLTALRRSPTGTLRYSEIVSVYAASGGSPAAAKVYLARSPVLQRVARGMYAARGDH